MPNSRLFLSVDCDAGTRGDLSARHELNAITFESSADRVMSIGVPCKRAILAL